MKLVSIRIITPDVKRLVAFYEKVSGMPAIQYTDDFAELQGALATLAIGSTRTLQLFGGDQVAQPAQNRSTIIEFIVDDVDSVYQRISETIQTAMVQKPTLMPWGNKSFLFRDPDGNLVNFFTPVSAEAIRKFEKTRL